MKRFFVLVITLILAFSMMPFQSFASEIISADEIGSITLTLQYKGDPIKDGTFSCIQVADVISEDANYYFRQLLNKNVIYKTIPDVNEVEKLVKDKENSKFFEKYTVTLTNKTGTVKFTNLKPGLYLIVQNVKSEGYSQIKPFLVSVPQNINGKYIFDVNACIKHELAPKPKPECPETTPTTPCTPTPKPPQKLPQTGQLNWPVPVLAASGMIMFLLGWWLTFGRKKDTYDA